MDTALLAYYESLGIFFQFVINDVRYIRGLGYKEFPVQSFVVSEVLITQNALQVLFYPFVPDNVCLSVCLSV